MTKRTGPEDKFVVDPILNKLRQYQIQGDVIWYKREEAADDIYAETGTPDIVVNVNCRNGKIVLLFIECKKPSKKKPSRDLLSFEQRLFFEGKDGEPMTLCVVINNPSQLWPAIKKAREL